METTKKKKRGTQTNVYASPPITRTHVSAKNRKISPNGILALGISSVPNLITTKVEKTARIPAHTRPDIARHTGVPLKQREPIQFGRRQSSSPAQLNVLGLMGGVPTTTFPEIHTHSPIFEVVPVTGTAKEIEDGVLPSFVWKRFTLVFVSFMSIPENVALTATATHCPMKTGTLEAIAEILPFVGGLEEACETLRPAHWVEKGVEPRGQEGIVYRAMKRVFATHLFPLPQMA